MKKKQTTKGKIVNAAWKLFHEQGYDNTTIDEIIMNSNTSKGSFYHYFSSKDELLSSISILFDERYEELMSNIDAEMNSLNKLLYLNEEAFRKIETDVSFELLASLYSSQLITKGEKHLLDQNRYYYKMLTQIVSEGQKRGQIDDVMTVLEIVDLYALCERALIYDWCIAKGRYSLAAKSAKLMPMFLATLKK